MKKLMFLIGLCGLLQVNAQLTNTVPAAGPVGIGTASPLPGNQLTVNGNTKIIGSIEMTGNNIVAGQSVFNSIVRMPGLASYAGVLNDFEILVVDEFGNITRGSLLTVMNGLSSLPVGLDHCSAAIIAAPHWFSAPSKLFSACPDVFVGVGTANPEYLLHVEGTSFQMKLLVGNADAPTDGLINGFSESPSQHLMQLGKKDGAGAEFINLLVKNDGSTVLSCVGSSVAFTLNNGTGHAIVVNNSSGDKIFQLEDYGLIRGRKMKLDLETWADYVFDPNYKLLSLEKTKEYIAKNAHLPNVPNEKEIQTEGLDIGEMMRIQMEKIEELTLHLIEMNERIKSLEEENSELKKSK